MKHTYLYPIADGELWLWRAARMDAWDLFGSPDLEADGEEWRLHREIGEASAKARDELHKRLKSRDRVCIGRSYVIPGSLCDVAKERAREADATVRDITQELWEAPYFYGHTWAWVIGSLKIAGEGGGRDEWADLQVFCKAHRCTKENGKRTRVIPVWM